MFAGALKNAARSSHHELPFVAELLSVMNRSDWGNDIDTSVLDAFQIDSGEPLGILLEANRSLAVGKLMLRRGARKEGLKVVEAQLSSPQFDELPCIPRGSLLRLHGILLAMSGSAAAARVDLDRAIEVFRVGGYQLGEVQSAMSLARATARADRQLTFYCLDRARQLVEATDHAGAHSLEGRQMPAERADLFARLADFKFAAGDFQEALELYQKDLETLQSLAEDPKHSLPRPAGYANRNLGRVLLALGQIERAQDHLVESCRLFERVNDRMNVFFSGALKCEAYLVGNDLENAAHGIHELEDLIATDPDRVKERAVVQTLTAQLALHEDPSKALALAVRARKDLQSFRDYYYVRALLVESEILTKIADVTEAKSRLVEARRCAMDNEIEDLRLVAEGRLQRLGVRSGELIAKRRTPLRIRCTQSGFVRTELVILFADIRGFTAASTLIPADSMALFIKEFAQLLGKCTSRHGGDPVRFLGDCVMALFATEPNAPPREVRAVQAAAEIHGLFSNLRTRWARGLPDLARLGLGFGISTGTVVAGTFGTDELSEFSVIGEPVNLAARLQGIASNGEIAICADTVAALQRVYQRLRLNQRLTDLKGLGEVSAFTLQVGDLLQAMTAQSTAREEEDNGPPTERQALARPGRAFNQEVATSLDAALNLRSEPR